MVLINVCFHLDILGNTTKTQKFASVPIYFDEDCSFDVSSLFTNIPLDETITIITDTLLSETGTLRSEDCSFAKIQCKFYLEQI